MTSDLNQRIKTCAYEVASQYLNGGSDMNEALHDKYVNGDIENKEILKRICEAANNTVYLSLFKDPKQDRSNISFPLADSQKIIKQADQENASMVADGVIVDYILAPEKRASSTAQPDGMSKIARKKEYNEFEKLAIKRKIQSGVDSITNLISGLEIIKTASNRRFSDLVDQLSRTGLSLMSAGESFGDMSKIAVRSVGPNHGESGMVKMAKICDHVRKGIESRGFKLSTELTKTSSAVIDQDSELSQLANMAILEVEKIAACDNMITGLKEVAKSYA